MAKHSNEANSLSLLVKNGPMSRAELARHLGVMRSTSGRIATDLLKAKLIREAISPPSNDSDLKGRSIGRPGELLEINKDYACFVGAEVGVGYIRIAVADFACTFRKTLELEISDHSAQANVKALKAAIPKAIEQAGFKETDSTGLCVAVPGIVNRKGLVIRAPHIGWHNIPFLDLLKSDLPEFPFISLENDANAFALADRHQRGTNALDNGLFIWIEAGIGGGVLRNGNLLRGEHGLAGEIGHIITGLYHPYLDQPIVRPWEELAGRVAVLNTSAHFGGEAKTLAEFVTNLRAGAEPETKAADIWVEAFSNGISTLNSILDPGEIVIGGPGALLFSELKAKVENALTRRLVVGTPLPNLRLSETGSLASAQGCAILCFEQFMNSDIEVKAARGASNTAKQMKISPKDAGHHQRLDQYP